MRSGIPRPIASGRGLVRSESYVRVVDCKVSLEAEEFGGRVEELQMGEEPFLPGTTF